MIDANGSWQPDLSPKQQQFRWAVHPHNPAKKKFHCISGPRRSSKTWAVLNAMVEHAWLVNDAHITLLTPTLSAGVDGGPWQLLTETIIPDWIGGDFGMEWHREPYVSGATKKPMLELVNIHGGRSKIQLDSMREGEDQIARQFKGKIFTMVVVSEASNWVKSATTNLMLLEVFRKPGIPTQQNTLIYDTNPAEEGSRHWIYQLFYEFRTQKDVPDNMRALQEQLHLTEFFVKDNPYLSKSDIDLMLAQYAHNPDLYARYFEGKWVTATGDGLFSDVFRPTIHVLGGIETPTNPEPEILVPEDNCFELFTGWDPGVSNYAAVILERFDKLKPDGKGHESAFKVLDELVAIRSSYTMGDFTLDFMDKLDFWEQQIGRPIRWTHFADRSVFDYRESISDRYQHQEVFAKSKGRIMLQAVPKGKDSVRQRIDLLRKLLFQDRLFISNSRCPKLIDSIQGLKRDKHGPVVRSSEYKHAFDALTYAVSTLCFEETEQAVRSVLAKPRKTTEPVSIVL